MKKVFLIFGIIVFSLVHGAKGQEPEYETIFSRKTAKNDRDFRMYATLMGYYSPITIGSEFINNSNLAAEVGISYKRKFGLGFTGQTISNYVSVIKNPQSITIPVGGAGIGKMPIFIHQLGGVFNYTHNPGKMLHAYTRLFVGGLYYSELNINSTELFNGSFMNPNVGLECNLLPYLTFRTELGYRFASLRDKNLYSKDVKLGGFIGGISLKIGNVR